MTNRKSTDPLVGDELIEVSLQPHHVNLIFSESMMQLGVPFEISMRGMSAKEIDPERRSGELTVLWSLVGKIVKAVIWEEKVSIIFIDGEVLSIGSSRGGPRGTIMGRHDMTIEDF